jgi:predicted RNase H-like nuclease
MPLSHEAIISRRTSDDLISKAYGSRYAATHTASATRPGSISTFLRDGFALEGYPLLVETPVRNGLIEVYPHPALIEFCDLPLRAPYKFGKIRKYWPEKTVAQRKANIVGEWDRIRSHLRSLFFNLNDVLPGFIDFDGPSWSWKAYEDKIDAVVCAAVGICALQGSAEPYGDCKSAIWVPKPGTMLPRRDAN